MSKTRGSRADTSAANLGFEAKLWLAADKLRNNMDAAEYKHVVLGLIFLKYISDAFEEMHAKLLAGKGDYKNTGIMENEKVEQYKLWPTNLDRKHFTDVVDSASKDELNKRHPVVRRKYQRKDDPRPKMIECYF